MTTQQNHRKVIAIHGCAGTGKSTLARTLKAALEGSWQITSFATPLKDVVNDLFFKYEIDQDPFADEEDKSAKSQVIDITRGKLLQETSDAIKNHFGKNIFCRIWDECNQEGQYFIIDDLRFIEEADWLGDNCETIFVKIDGKPELNDGRNPGHYGEMGLDVNRFDIVLPEQFEVHDVNGVLGLISRWFHVGRHGVSQVDSFTDNSYLSTFNTGFNKIRREYIQNHKDDEPLARHKAEIGAYKIEINPLHHLVTNKSEKH